jgi:hypothetical protein
MPLTKERQEPQKIKALRTSNVPWGLIGVVKALLAREEKIAMKLGVLTIFKTVGD